MLFHPGILSGIQRYLKTHITLTQVKIQELHPALKPFRQLCHRA